jgi:hypothetical protein
MTTRPTSLKATTPLDGLRGAQSEYEQANKQFRQRQREILQDVFANVVAAIQGDDSKTFRDEEDFAEYAGDESADIWFDAVAFVYKAKTRTARQKASKHASALRLLYEEGVAADRIAAEIKERHGIQRLADEAAENSDDDEEKDEEEEEEGKKGKGRNRAEKRSGAVRGPRDADDLTLHVEMVEERLLEEVLDLEIGQKATITIKREDKPSRWGKRIIGLEVVPL